MSHKALRRNSSQKNCQAKNLKKIFRPVFRLKCNTAISGPGLRWDCGKPQGRAFHPELTVFNSFTGL
jgi:hypothetical protein